MSFNRGLFSSLRLDWRTPQSLYKKLNEEFHFNYDPCPNRSWAWDTDGLVIEWGTRNFVNPPYGREVGKWVKKGWEESQQGRLVVMLLAARTDTSWWHDYVMKADEIRFIRGRLHFDERGPAPFPSAVVVFGKERHD